MHSTTNTPQFTDTPKKKKSLTLFATSKTI